MQPGDGDGEHGRAEVAAGATLQSSPRAQNHPRRSCAGRGRAPRRRRRRRSRRLREASKATASEPTTTAQEGQRHAARQGPRIELVAGRGDASPAASDQKARARDAGDAVDRTRRRRRRRPRARRAAKGQRSRSDGGEARGAGDARGCSRRRRAQSTRRNAPPKARVTSAPALGARVEPDLAELGEAPSSSTARKQRRGRLARRCGPVGHRRADGEGEPERTGQRRLSRDEGSDRAAEAARAARRARAAAAEAAAAAKVIAVRSGWRPLAVSASAGGYCRATNGQARPSAGGDPRRSRRRPGRGAAGSDAPRAGDSGEREAGRRGPSRRRRARQRFQGCGAAARRRGRTADRGCGWPPGSGSRRAAAGALPAA